MGSVLSLGQATKLPAPSQAHFVWQYPLDWREAIPIAWRVSRRQLPFIETFVPQTSSLNPNLSLTVRNMPPTLRQPNFIKPYRSPQIAARFPTIFFWYGKRLPHFGAKLRKNDSACWDINPLKTELSLLNSCSVNVILRKEGIRAVLWLFRSVVLKLVNKKTRIAQVVRGIYWGIILC